MKSGNYQHLAMNNFSNLKGFASKMREQARDAARDAAKKLPSLDEMAAKDDYIHTEEFNVKGEKPERNIEEQQQVKGDEKNQLAAPSPWSLIDKRVFQKEEESAAAAETVPSAPSSISQRDEIISMKSNQSQNGGNAMPANDAPIKTAPIKPRSVMMSVVTDAMIPTPVSPEPDVEEDDDDDNSIVSDSSSDSDGDEEDPILSMIRQDKGEDDKVNKKNPKPKSKKKKRTSSKEPPEPPKMHRFLTDMADAENQLETNNSQQAKEEQQAPKITITIPASPRELGSWMKNMASNQMNKILKRPAPSSAPTTSAAPPLASTWRSKPAHNPLQEEFHSQDSSNLLGDDELKQLAMMKQQGNSGGTLRVMLGGLYEYRHFGFIAFTLILAGVVYFFKFGALEDGVI